MLPMYMSWYMSAIAEAFTGLRACFRSIIGLLSKQKEMFLLNCSKLTQTAGVTQILSSRSISSEDLPSYPAMYSRIIVWHANSWPIRNNCRNNWQQVLFFIFPRIILFVVLYIVSQNLIIMTWTQKKHVKKNIKKHTFLS